MRRLGVLTASVLVLMVLVTGTAAAIPEGPEPGTPEWFDREANNFAKTREESNRELSSPEFQARLRAQSATNEADYATFQADNGFINAGNLCARWEETCAGDPFRYPGSDPFYDDVGEFTEGTVGAVDRLAE